MRLFCGRKINQKGTHMRRYLLLILVVSFLAISFSRFTFAANDKDKSIGTATGETARDLQAKAQETAKVAAVETEKASKQIAEVADDTFKKLNVQLQEALKNFQGSSQELMKRIQEEFEKFKQAYNKPAKP